MQKLLKRFLSIGLSIAFCFSLTTVIGTASDVLVVDAVTDYYSSITATSGTALLGQVHDLITTTHKTYTSYADCKNPTYVKQTDPGSSSSYVMEFYSQADISATWGSGNLGTWNREHVWCQSRSNGMWGETGGGADMHHIRPAETRLNSTRNNDPYGEISNRESHMVYYTDANKNNVALGGYQSGGTFEPLDKVKGDVARIVMYVYTHYNTYKNVGGTTNGSGSYFGTLKFTSIIDAKSEEAAQALLLKWNEMDPPDEIEMTRNNAVESIQGNRNPFVDHPEYADAIWGDTAITPDPDPELTGLTVDPSSFTLNEGRSQQLTAIPTPANADGSVTWTSSDTTVATVSEKGGVVTAKSVGTATITATSTVNPAITATAQVTVQANSSTDPTGETETATIILNSFDLSYGYGFKSWSAGELSGTAFIYGGSSAYPVSSMQFNKSQSSYYLASTVEAPGPIKSVTVASHTGSTDRPWKLLTSTTPYGEVKGKPTNGNDHGTKTVTPEGVTWTVSGEDTCFALTYEQSGSGSAAAYLDSIVIEYVSGSDVGGEEEHTAHDGWTAWADNGDGTHSRETTCESHDPVEQTEDHTFRDGSCTVCGAADPDYNSGGEDGGEDEHTAHDGWTAWSDSGNGTHSRETTCESHDPVEQTEDHTFRDGSCTVCGAADPDYNLGGEGGEKENLTAFHTAVEGIVSSGTLEARLTSINRAIVAYRALSEEEKAQAQDDIAKLQAAINAYNELVGSYNEDAENANKAAWGHA